MPTPPPLVRDTAPAGRIRRRDPVAGLTAVLLVLVIAGLLATAILVVSSYGILAKGQSAPQMTSVDVVAPLALATAVVFFAAVVLNVFAATVRHLRAGS